MATTAPLRATRPPIRPARVAVFTTMVLASFVTMYPFYYMMNTSFRTRDQYQAGEGHSLDSWRTLFSSLPVGQLMLNSLIITTGALLIIVAVSTSAGFAFARLSSRASSAGLSVVVACMLIPLQSIVLPQFINISNIGLIDTRLGAILVYAVLGTPFATYLMTTYFRALPEELVEAGILDGLSYGGVFLRIGLPTAAPAIATVLVLQFIQIWCDLLVGLLYLPSPEHRTITTGLGVLASGRVTSIPVLMAGATISALPAIAVYLLLQRHLTKALFLGSSK